MDRTLAGDGSQLVQLFLGAAVREAQHEAELGGRAALGRLKLAFDLQVREVPALALGVHLHRDRGAGGNARGQQLLGGGPSSAPPCSAGSSSVTW